MKLSVLIDKLKIDVNDSTLTFNVVKRCFERAAARVNKDLETAYVITGDTLEDCVIEPDPTARDQELLLILAMRHLVSMDIISASDTISWKSGDKSVDRSRTALSKENALAILLADYRALAGLDDTDIVQGESYESSGGDIDLSSSRSTWMDR